MYLQTDDNIIISKNVATIEEPIGGIGTFLFEKMKLHKERIAIIDSESGNRETYEELLQKCIRTAIFLQKKGYKKGDIIIYCSTLHINTYTPMLASLFIGLIPSFIEVNNTPIQEVEHIFSELHPKVALVDPCFFEIIQSVIDNAKFSVEIISFDTHFFKQQKQEEIFTPIYIDNLKETAALFFSSGSTGLPKAVCLNHFNLTRNSAVREENQDFERIAYIATKTKDNKVWLSYDSLYWAVECTRLTKFIKNGDCRLISSQFDACNIWKLIEKYKVNELYLIPHFISEMCINGNSENADTSSLYKITSLGSSMARKYINDVQKLLPTVDFVQAYGQTECGYITEFLVENKHHREYFKMFPDSVGLPVSDIKLKVVDLDTGKNLGPNCEGELRIKTNQMMNGYLNHNSSQDFDENGWWKTGDLVYYNENYCFFIVSRLKDFIIYQGWHISPITIEKVILTHPAVKIAVVIGKRHEVDDEHPLALVVLHEGFGTITSNDIKEYADTKLPDREKLRGGVKIIDQIPLTANGKLKRGELKKYALAD